MTFRLLGRGVGLASLATTTSLVTRRNVVFCEGEGTENATDKVNDMMKQLVPMTGAFSFGTVSGFCSGFALKKLGKAAAATFGVVFMGFQAAAYAGYVNVNWPKIEQDLFSVMDVNKDGKVDQEDTMIVYHKLINVFSANMGSSATGFGAGFLLGLKKG